MQQPFRLLDLPDPCLLAVLQRCSDNRSLIIAARTHSRLHKAAVAALRSINTVLPTQQQADGVLLYLRKHGQHVNSIALQKPGHHGEGEAVTLHCPPANLQLGSLQLTGLRLQLRWLQSVADWAVALKKLHLEDCRLVGSGADAAMTTALLQLSGLEHLSLCRVTPLYGYILPAAIFQQLQQLTSLELAEIWFSSENGSDGDDVALQPLEAATQLLDLRLTPPGGSLLDPKTITTTTLSGTQRLTWLDLSHCNRQPDTLAGRTQLQHLHLMDCTVLEQRAGLALLLSDLQQMQQLTHLAWVQMNSWPSLDEQYPPAAAYAALTASSKLQQLDINGLVMPEGALQHIFPANRQLPHLRSLNVEGVSLPITGGWRSAALDGSRIVSCCPGLQSLFMGSSPNIATMLASLQGLSTLNTLSFNSDSTAEGVEVVGRLTGLQKLTMRMRYVTPAAQEVLLLQLTQLKQLTELTIEGSEGLLRMTVQVSPAQTELAFILPSLDATQLAA